MSVSATAPGRHLGRRERQQRVGEDDTDETEEEVEAEVGARQPRSLPDDKARNQRDRTCADSLPEDEGDDRDAFGDGDPIEREGHCVAAGPEQQHGERDQAPAVRFEAAHGGLPVTP